MKITAKELHEKSIQQQVTHRRAFEDLSEDQKFKLEAYAEWCNEIIKNKMPPVVASYKLQDVVDYFAKDLTPKPTHFDWFLDTAKQAIVFKIYTMDE